MSVCVPIGVAIVISKYWFFLSSVTPKEHGGFELFLFSNAFETMIQFLFYQNLSLITTTVLCLISAPEIGTKSLLLFTAFLH